MTRSGRFSLGWTIASVGLAGPAAGTVWHVDATAPPGGDGLSWTSAFAHLQDALTHPDIAIGDEVRVAEGRYYPDRSAADSAGTDEREARFRLINGVSIYGGFPAGGGDGSFEARDPGRFESTLSGDLFEPAPRTFDVCGEPPVGSGGCFDGTPGAAGCRDGSCCDLVCDAVPVCCIVEWDPQCADVAADLCSHRVYNVVYCFVVNAGARLDGFTITGGYADHPESIYRRMGGGMLVWNGAPVIVRCRFTDNRAERGGGLTLLGTSADARIVNGVFARNRAAEGGGVYIEDGSPQFINCVFHDNGASDGRGGAVYDSTTGSSITNGTVAGNTAATAGGGVYGVSFVKNSVLWGNTPDQVAGTIGVAYSCVEGAISGPGNLASDPAFVDPAAGNFRLRHDSPCVDRAHNGLIAPDAGDLDGDAEVGEPTPLDLDLARRVLNGTVDAGAYELCRYDLNGDGAVGIPDLIALIGAWGTDPGGPPDLDGDGDVGISDFLELLGKWGPCT